MSIVFATLFAAKQGAGRAECTEGIDRDYATGADVTEKGQSGTPVPTKSKGCARKVNNRAYFIFLNKIDELDGTNERLLKYYRENIEK